MTFLRSTFMNVYKKRLYPNYWDIIALFFALGGIILLAWNARQMAVPYYLGEPIQISLDPKYLPGYAFRSVMRMFIALTCSLLFTFTVATLAAKSRRAERVIIPLIDILQSVPILGFLTIMSVFFIQLFPGSLLGPECAAIFVIFTSQAWNIALGFYQTLRLVPGELIEAAHMFHLSPWQRFWRIDVPFSMPGLLWNSMMSMSAGWFFVVASEAFSVSKQQILLPGIGSYIALASSTKNLRAIGYAIIAMLIVILIYDQLLFRPLVAWAEKFKSDMVPSEHESRSWVINFLHRTRLLRYIGHQIENCFDWFVNLAPLRSKPNLDDSEETSNKERWFSYLWNVVFILSAFIIIGLGCFYIYSNVPLNEVGHVFYLGLITTLRVVLLIFICSLIWVPVGVWVGMRPRAAYFAQPIVQFLAAFPANLLYPLMVILIVHYHLNVNIWLTPLIILGAQWYILFNVIAGASQIPKDLLLVTDNLGLNTALRWRRLILPAIFPYYITGAITAAGGAWNASILAEIVSWGHTKLIATGLGSYITHYSEAGDFGRLALGIGVMCIIVLLFNRIVWRPLYVLAERRYFMD